MAGLMINGLDDLLIDLQSIIEMPKDVKEDMLKAGAKVVSNAQKQTAKSMGVYDSNQRYPATHVSDAVKQSKVYHNSDGAATYVYPQGNRRRAGKTTRQGEVAFINEFGKSGQPARQFIRTANERSADQAAEAEMKAYDEFLTKNNF